ncbi:hypothetical protein HG530_006241 [Fusarium avenaceum]|nr:hypothetical protein HG530_006241 [Fusarium avenaceum]
MLDLEDRREFFEGSCDTLPTLPRIREVHLLGHSKFIQELNSWLGKLCIAGSFGKGTSSATTQLPVFALKEGQHPEWHLGCHFKAALLPDLMTKVLILFLIIMSGNPNLIRIAELAHIDIGTDRLQYSGSNSSFRHQSTLRKNHHLLAVHVRGDAAAHISKTILEKFVMLGISLHGTDKNRKKFGSGNGLIAANICVVRKKLDCQY